jgi:methyl-accepting chemotaxis protein
VGIFKQIRWLLLGVLVISSTGLGLAYLGLMKAQENVEVGNQIGLLRGSSQRSVKLELAGKKSDQLIENIELLIQKIRKQKKRVYLSSKMQNFYQYRINFIDTEWKILEQLIQKSRKDSRFKPLLLTQSEAFWELCDRTALEAQELSRQDVYKTIWIELLLIAANAAGLFFFYVKGEKIAKQVRETLSFVTFYTGDVLATIEKQERGIHQQALCVNETTITVDQLRASSYKAAENSNLSVEQAERVVELANSGDRLVEQTLMEVINIKDEVDSMAEQIQQLSQQTAQIGQISIWVKDLAFQTNILALNANIEAVRAGDSGQEFSVVAREIRQLAVQSQEAGEKISAIVTEIHSTILSTIKATATGAHKATEGEQIARETAASFIEVKDAIDRITIAAREVAYSAREQLVALQQISESMNSLNQSATETVTEIRQTQLETQKFTELMLNLKNLMG